MRPARLPRKGKLPQPLLVPGSHSPRLPLPSVHRQKADAARPLEGPRYHVHANGTLQVREATAEDAGAYSCWVENAQGKTAVTASLDIRSESALFPPAVNSYAGPVGLHFPA